MPVISQKAKLVYFDVPKVACTSLKSFFWQLDNGNPPKNIGALWYRLRHEGKRFEIHHQAAYRTCSYSRSGEVPAGFDSVTIVRDPIMRLHSSWKNKANAAVFEKRNETRDIWLESIPTNPSFGEYIDHLLTYQMVSRAVRIHTYDYDWHLGPSLDAYDRVFKLEKLSEFQDFLTERLGYEVTFGRENTTSTETRSSELNSDQRDKLREITRKDYEWLGGRYSFDESYDRFESKTKKKVLVTA